MAGVTLPKIMALAAASSVAMVGVLAEVAPMDMPADAPMAMEMPAEAPVEAPVEAPMEEHGEMMELGAMGYKSYVGKEYIPEDAAAAVAENVGSSVAASDAECAMACDALEGCNGASYYPDPEALGSEKNCWLKTFQDSCDIPMDSIEEPDSILLLKPTADCPADDVAPMMATGAMGAAAPMSGPLVADAAAAGPAGAVGADGTTTGTRAFTVGDGTAEGPASEGTEGTVGTSGSVCVRSAVAALAVAGAFMAL